MKEKDREHEIATFRFGLIAEFVTGVCLAVGEKEKLLREKSSRTYKIPYSSSTRVSRSTLKKWISDYNNAGGHIEGLMPTRRKDRGHFRSLDLSLQLAIKEIKAEKDLTGVALVRELRQRKYIGPTERINLSVLYSFLKKNNLERPKKLIDRRAFEADNPNELWQSDILHGPLVLDGSKKRKAYLIAIIDDNSRLIPHAQFYFSERLDDFKSCLKSAIEKRGLPQKLYIDNGACYKAMNVEQVAACLGIGIIHTPPYRPTRSQGQRRRGKEHRWTSLKFKLMKSRFNSMAIGIRMARQWGSDLSVLYSFLKKNNLERPKKLIDRRAFEADNPNELWQSDILHGPLVLDGSKKRKAYLIAIIDDNSRLIPHAQFYFSERLDDFKSCLKSAIEKRGLPQKLYIDNGACYKAMNVEQVAACLGIGIIHTPPYTPQGRGKIERWFRYVRESFLSLCRESLGINELNERFYDWIEEYHNKVHSTTGQTPLERYRLDMKCVRVAPPDLYNYFRFIEFRRVKKDRTLRLNGTVFEAPVELIDYRVELRFHRESPEDVEIFYDGRSFGKATLLNKGVNFRVGRNCKITVEDKNINIAPGELF